MLSCFVLITQAAAIPHTGTLAKSRGLTHAHLARSATRTCSGTQCRPKRTHWLFSWWVGKGPFPPSLESGTNLCHCVSVFHTNTNRSESFMCVWAKGRGVESSSHTHACRSSLPPLLPAEDTWQTEIEGEGEPEMNRFKKNPKQNVTHSSWIKFCCWIILFLHTIVAEK